MTFLSRKEFRQALLERVFEGSRVSLLIQEPIALAAVHPLAAYDLRHKTTGYLRELSKKLRNQRNKVDVVLHPAATLSMTVVDWQYPQRAAVVVPRLQINAATADRVPIVMTGKLFDRLVGAAFQRMLTQAKRNQQRAAIVPLSQAAQKIERLFAELESKSPALYREMLKVERRKKRGRSRKRSSPR